MEVAIIPKRKTQEVDARHRLVQVHYASLLAIDRQLEAAFELVLHPVDELFALIAGQDDEIVRVANDLRLRPVGRAVRSVKGLFEPVQVDVRQEGRDRSSNDIANIGGFFDRLLSRESLRPGYGEGWKPP